MSQLQQGNRLQASTGENLDSSIPLHQRDEWWLRWPAQVLRETQHGVAPFSRHEARKDRATTLFSFLWQWIKSDIFHFLVVFVPFALVAGHRGWGSKIVFFLGILSLAGLDAVISSSLELVCLPFSAKKGTAFYLLDLTSLVTPTTTSIVAMLLDQATLAQDIIIGCAVANILLGTGASLLFTGLAQKGSAMAGYNSVATDMSNLMWTSLGPLIFRCALDSVINSGSKVPDARSRNTTRITSTISAAALILIFASWLWYKRTHSRVWALSFTHHPQWELQRTRAEKLNVAKLTQLTLCVIATSSLVAMVFVIRFVTTSIVALASTTSITTEFFGYIVLPLTLGCSSYVKAADSAYHTHAWPSISATFGLAIGNVTITFPLLLFISWGYDFDTYNNITFLHLAQLTLAVWLGSYMTQRFTTHYLDGIVCLSCYAIVGLSIYLH